MSDFPTDKMVCLCCGGPGLPPRRQLTQEDWEYAWELFEGMGYTRHELLTKHREQIDYQMPGLAEWLNQ